MRVATSRSEATVLCTKSGISGYCSPEIPLGGDYRQFGTASAVMNVVFDFDT